MKQALAVVLLGATSCASLGGASLDPVLRKNPEVPVTAVDLGAEKGQNSPLLAADPVDPRFMALASRIDGPTFGCDLHVTGDGGKTWVPANPVPELPKGSEKCYAPEVTIDENGALHYFFVGLHTLGNTPMGAFLTSSRDRGLTFSPPRRLLGGSRYMVRMALATQPERKRRLHLAWLQPSTEPPIGGLPPGENPILHKFSRDGGRTFSRPARVSDRRRERVVAPALALGPEEAVHVAYYDLRDDARDYQGLPGPRWDGEWSLVLASSFDGGRRFTQHTSIDDRLVPPERVMLILTMPPPSIAVDPSSGDIHVAWWDMRSGDWDVFLSRSTDRGRSFSPPARMSDDREGNGRHQYLPKISIAEGGRLDALFYDRRDDPGNKDNHVYYTFSDDGGRQFAHNLRLTSVPSNTRTGARYPIPSAEGLVEMGGRLGLVSEAERVTAAWTDTRLPPPGYLNQNIFAAQVRLPGASGPGPDALSAPWVLAIAATALILLLLVGSRRWSRASKGRRDSR